MIWSYSHDPGQETRWPHSGKIATTEILTNKRDSMTVNGTVASSDPFVLYHVKQLLSNVSP